MFLKPAGYSHKRRPHIPIPGLRLGHLLGTGKPSISQHVSCAVWKHKRQHLHQPRGLSQADRGKLWLHITVEASEGVFLSVSRLHMS